MITPHNIYIHVPYCISKCNYCAFFSRAISPDWESYCNQICTEIDYWFKKLGRIIVPTVFFGGGTPSLMPTNVFQKIIQHLNHNFDLSHCDEITVESNPGTITYDKLQEFIANGMTRLSIGVQSFDDDELKFLGRKHDAQTAIKLIKDVQKSGIRVSADFIYGLPNHNVKSVINLCTQINDIGLQHASLYELTVEPNTPFGHMDLNMPSNDEMADMYLAIQNHLNLSRYEVSNYSAPNQQCQHNQNVWDGDAYIGLGNGAMGRVLINGDWFEQSGGDIKTTKIDTNTRATERIITGLRTTRGVLMDRAIKNIVDIDFINSNNELVQIKDNRIIATPKGLLTLDNLILHIIK
jgi:oxygen-independent coproporphyrinogen-3 oxidase